MDLSSVIRPQLLKVGIHWIYIKYQADHKNMYTMKFVVVTLALNVLVNYATATQHYESHDGEIETTHSEISKPVPVPVIEKIPVAIPHPVPVHVPNYIRIQIPEPYAVHVPVQQEVEVPVYKVVPEITERRIPYPVEKPFPIEVERPYPVEVLKRIEIPIPRPYAVPVTVYKHVLQREKSGWQY